MDYGLINPTIDFEKAFREQRKQLSEEEMFRNLASLLTPEARLMIFEEYCQILKSRIPEKVWLETGIRKTDVYRYFPKSKSRRGGKKPNPATTARMIYALLKKHGKHGYVAEALEPARHQMRATYRKYDDWVSKLRRYEAIDNPMSENSILKLEKSLPGIREE